MGKTKSLKDRMTNYQDVTNIKLIKRMPVIIRLDGKAFHTFTKGLTKPFDEDLSNIFQNTCLRLKREIQGVKLIYSQSDEISLLLTDWDKLTTDSWLDYRVQKMISISASLASCFFNEEIMNVIKKYDDEANNSCGARYLICCEKRELWKSKLNKAVFDSRAFNIPKEDVTNYFIYRQQDAIRNSKQALGQAHFSHKELDGINVDDICVKVFGKVGIHWEALSTNQKRGFCILEYISIIDCEIPLFKENRDKDYIERYLR